MKIAYLHQYFTTPEMSGGTRSYEMARRLVEYGHDVEMITSRRERSDTNGWTVTQEEGINIHWLPVPYSNHMGFRQRVGAFAHFALAAKARAVFTRPDLIFATSTPLTIALPGARAARTLSVPMVFEVRDLWPEMPIATGDLRSPLLIALAKKLERYAYMNAQEVVALSPGMAEGVVRMGFPRDRTTVIPNSADLDLFSDSASSMREVLPDAPDLSGRKLIVYCGTFGRVNKVTYIAEIAAEARKIDPSLVFFAIGDGAECDLIRDTAKAMGVLGHNMFLYPPIKKVEVPSILKAAALSLSLFADVPEMQNNSANKFFDTLAAGRPIGINYQGWQAELIRSGGIGIVLPSTDPAAAAREISGFLADAEAVESAGIRARRMAETHFDRDILARNLNEVLVRARSEFRSRI